MDYAYRQASAGRGEINRRQLHGGGIYSGGRTEAFRPIGGTAFGFAAGPYRSRQGGHAAREDRCRRWRLSRRGGGHAHPALREGGREDRSEEHTSELQSLMRISYAVFCLKKKTYIILYTNR